MRDTVEIDDFRCNVCGSVCMYIYVGEADHSRQSNDRAIWKGGASMLNWR